MIRRGAGGGWAGAGETPQSPPDAATATTHAAQCPAALILHASNSPLVHITVDPLIVKCCHSIVLWVTSPRCRHVATSSPVSTPTSVNFDGDLSQSSVELTAILYEHSTLSRCQYFGHCDSQLTFDFSRTSLDGSAYYRNSTGISLMYRTAKFIWICSDRFILWKLCENKGDIHVKVRTPCYIHDLMFWALSMSYRLRKMRRSLVFSHYTFVKFIYFYSRVLVGTQRMRCYLHDSLLF